MFLSPAKDRYLELQHIQEPEGTGLPESLKPSKMPSIRNFPYHLARALSRLRQDGVHFHDEMDQVDENLVVEYLQDQLNIRSASVIPMTIEN